MNVTASSITTQMTKSSAASIQSHPRAPRKDRKPSHSEPPTPPLPPSSFGGATQRPRKRPSQSFLDVLCGGCCRSESFDADDILPQDLAAVPTLSEKPRAPDTPMEKEKSLRELLMDDPTRIPLPSSIATSARSEHPKTPVTTLPGSMNRRSEVFLAHSDIALVVAEQKDQDGETVEGKLITTGQAVSAPSAQSTRPFLTQPLSQIAIKVLRPIEQADEAYLDPKRWRHRGSLLRQPNRRPEAVGWRPGSHLLEKQILSWKKLANERIHVPLGYSLAENAPCLISPWCSNGNLWQYLEAHPDTDRKALVRLFTTPPTPNSHLRRFIDNSSRRRTRLPTHPRPTRLAWEHQTRKRLDQPNGRSNAHGSGISGVLGGRCSWFD